MSAADVVCRLTLGSRIAPLAIMGSAVRPGTRSRRASGVAQRSSKLAPDPHRTEPKVGGYRGDAGGLPAPLTPNCQLVALDIAPVYRRSMVRPEELRNHG